MNNENLLGVADSIDAASGWVELLRAVHFDLLSESGSQDGYAGLQVILDHLARAYQVLEVCRG